MDRACPVTRHTEYGPEKRSRRAVSQTRAGLSRYRDLEEMMADRGSSVDHSAIAGWVLRYAPVLNERIRSEMRIQTVRGGATVEVPV